MKTQKSRLEHFIKNYLGMSVRAFERSAGISQSLISQAKDNLSDNIIDKVCKAYPMLNRIWLLSGDGNMINNITIGDTTIPIDLSQGKREVSGDGNTYIEGGDAVAMAKLQMEIDALKQQVATLQDQLKEAREERDKANARIDQYILGTLNRQ